MRMMDIVMDLRVWVISAIIISLLTDTLDIPSSGLIIAVLMVQMTLSMDGLKLSISDLRENNKDAILSVILTFVVNTAMTLTVGAVFIPNDQAIWHGWVILASMPCAIAVVTAAVLTSERVDTSFVGVTATYLAGIVITPVLSFVLIGDAVNPLEILKYIVLFILIPLILSRPIGKLRLKRTVKVPVINMMMFVMIFLSVNSNHGYIMNDPMFILGILAVVIVRVLLLMAVTTVILKVAKVPDDRHTVLLVMGVWKNTGLSVSMCMLLLSSTPESVIPCFLSLIVECIWFSIITRKKDPERDTTYIGA